MASKPTNDEIQKVAKEFYDAINFLDSEGAYFRDPENTALKKEGREDFFGQFYQHDRIYHTVEEKVWVPHNLKLYMLIPKTLKLDKPILFHVFFHGGGLCTGGGNYIHWWHDYKRDLAIDANAVTLVPMYRLMPESDGEQIYQDVADWWKFYQSSDCHDWVRSKILEHFSGKILDLSWDGLLISGESAGGLLAVHSWLTGPSDLKIRALYLQYPMLHYYKKPMPTSKDGKPAAVEYMKHPILVTEVVERANALVELVERRRKERRVVFRSDFPPPNGMLAAMMLSNTGLWERVFKGGKTEVRDAPEELVQRMKNDDLKPHCFPRFFIVHATNDGAVPISKTDEFVESLYKALQKWDIPKSTVLFEKIPFKEIEKAGGHGFDYEYKKNGTSPGEKIVSGVVDKVIEAWKA